MLNRDYLGFVAKPVSVPVEAGQIRLFNKAIGETRPVYNDETAARAAGHRSLLAPPTFGNCLQQLATDVGITHEDVGLDFRYLLHGGESFIYHGPIYAGDTITLQTEITDMYDKKNGALEFMETVTRATNQLGELVQERRMVTVMRYPQGEQS